MALYAYSAPRRARRLACAWAAGAALLMSAAARAEQPLKITPDIAEQTAEAPKRDEKGAREQELARIRADQKRAAEVQAKLTAEIDAIGEDRRKLSQALIETATRLRDIETRITETEGKVAALDENANAIRKTLHARRAIIAELLAALQRLGHRPPPALLVRPEDALKAVRTAIMLGAVLPEMRLEAEALVADLSELVQVRRQIDEQRAKLNHDVASLSDEQQRMTGLIEQRQKRQVEIEKEMADERARAATLARQAGNLKDLIAKLDQNAAAAQRAAKSALQKGEPPPDGPNNAAVVRDARLGPAIAFAATKGTLSLPVSGVKVRDFGAPDAGGGSVKGVSINTRLGAQVTAPCDGWVVYAGPFRSYGQLLILNAGGGYHVLLAGMERISVDLGQFVLTGEPIAAMGGGPQASAPAAHSGSPTTLYVEFRKDGTPVDPGPWWAVTESEKVRG
jgi:septal ring factor EnvC (AmiA/AmiB activator)